MRREQFNPKKCPPHNPERKYHYLYGGIVRVWIETCHDCGCDLDSGSE